MKLYFKILVTAFCVFVICFLIFATYELVQSHFIGAASLFSIAVILFIFLALLGLMAYSLTKLWFPSIILLLFIVQGCNYAKSNQQVVVSDDCGMNWKMIRPGDAVPKGVANPCYMKVVIPNFPMQGDSRFVSNLKDRVRASVHIDYDYSIIEPLKFIKQAKYLGKANSDADSNEALDQSYFEGAENMVIDKRIRDISKEMFLNEDIVELDQSEIEGKLQIQANKVLNELGVNLNFITLTFDLDEQTRQAIDVTTAMKIYESKGLSEVGKSIIVSRAGATKITVETKNEVPNKAE